MEADFPRKLGFKATQRVYLLNPPAGFAEELGQIIPGIVFVNSGGAGPLDMVIAWPESGVGGMLRQILPALKLDGAIWVVIPKKASKAPGPSFDSLLEVALPLGLVDNKTLSFSAREYGVRFVIRRKMRRPDCDCFPA